MAFAFGGSNPSLRTKPMIDEFKKLIDQSDKILVTSHISPDPDAFCSTLLLGNTLKLNYPAKKVATSLEELPVGLGFLDGASEVENESLLQKTQTMEPDLLVMLDGNNYDRFSRKNGSELRSLVKEEGIKTVIIDHHELTGKDEVNVFINRHSPATTQDVYQILFNDLKFRKPNGYAQTAMLGFYADTGGLTYIKDFDFANQLLADGANIEAARNKLHQYTEADMKAIGALASNTTHGNDYSYSFLTDDFIEQWLASGKSQADLQASTNAFVNEFIRNIEGRSWGFIVYRNSLEGDNVYSISFRALGDTKDVSEIAAKLNGGGHKPAAGAKVQAASVQGAIEAVQQAISD